MRLLKYCTAVLLKIILFPVLCIWLVTFPLAGVVALVVWIFVDDYTAAKITDYWIDVPQHCLDLIDKLE